MNRPALSVVIGVQQTWSELDVWLRVMRRQTIRDQLEIVVVSNVPLTVAETQLADFWGYQVVVRPPHEARYAAGVRAAQADYIALAEEHSFPAPKWAAGLLAAHASGEYAVVAPIVYNANPQSLVSWGDFLLSYGNITGKLARQERTFLCGHNACYRRSALQRYTAELDQWLVTDVALQEQMARDGLRLLLEPTIILRHTNFSRLLPFMRVQFHAGRVYAVQRCQKWRLGQRLLYIALCPLIPWVRLGRIRAYFRHIPPHQRRRLLPWIMPLLLWLAIVATAGEVVGYLTKQRGQSLARLTAYEELPRRHFLNAADVTRWERLRRV